MAAPQPGRLWAVVLADDAAAPLRTVLEHTGRAFSPAATVAAGTHRERLAEETATFEGNVLTLPANRGSALLRLWPIYWIHRFDPEAVVASIPACQALRDGPAFLAHVVRVAGGVANHPRWLVMVGDGSLDREGARDLIVRAESLDDAPERVWRVRELRDASPARQSARYLARDCLWNTRVVVGRARAFIEAARICLPQLDAAFSQAARCAGTWEEAEAMERAYEQIAECQFLAALKAAAFPLLATSCLPRRRGAKLQETA